MEEHIIREIAKNNLFNKEQEELLVELMLRRFPMEQSPSYVSEWATRIVKGSAFARGDLETQRILISLGVTK